MSKCQCKKKKSKGFTLIELLVVIIVIGILAGVLLLTVRSAILKARDSRIIAAIGQFRTYAEMYYDNQTIPSYTGLFNETNADYARIRTEIQNNGGSIHSTTALSDSYRLVVQLNVRQGSNVMYYCVNSNGYACRIASVLGGSYYCGCSGEPAPPGGGGGGGGGDVGP